MNLFERIWFGEIPLVKTYWIYGVLIGGLLSFLTKNSYSLSTSTFLHIATYLLLVGYFFLVSVGMWRSADKYKGIKLWAVLAKIWVVVNLTFTTLVLINLTKLFPITSSQTATQSSSVSNSNEWIEEGKSFRYKKNEAGIAMVEFRTPMLEFAKEVGINYQYTLIQMYYSCNDSTEKMIAMYNVVKEGDKLKELPIATQEKGWQSNKNDTSAQLSVFESVCGNKK